MTTPTKAEQAAIKAAASAIAYLSQSTNWSDEGAWQNAIKLERKQGLTLTEAQGKCVEQWYKGASNPQAPLADVYDMRPGVLKARLLGVRHAIERADSDYTGPLVREALDLCPAAIDALRAHFRRAASAVGRA